MSRLLDRLAWWLIGMDVSNRWHPPRLLIGWAVDRVVWPPVASDHYPRRAP